MKALEIVLDYVCECRCIFCPSPSLAATAGFSAATARKLAEWGRRKGARTLWINGGEPTMRVDLPDLIAAADGLGYEVIRVKTNGISLADRARAAALVAAGAGFFSVSVWGAPEVHGRLAGRPGAWKDTSRGIDNLVRAGAQVGADVLITTSNIDPLKDVVGSLAGQGVTSLTYSLVSLHGMKGGHAEELLPRMTDVLHTLLESVGIARRMGVRAIRIQHIPPCLLGDAAPYAHDTVAEDLFVVTPGSRFMLQDSPFMGGVKTPECEACAYSFRCLGLRPDYVRVWGDGEVKGARRELS